MTKVQGEGRLRGPITREVRLAERDWWRGAVIYQIYPRSFQDSNDDGVGDLPGITQRMPYVADLGVDAIWISPFFRSPMKDFGYDVSDYRDVDPIFGTLEDFDRLLAEAHSLGVRVMIDQVLSHTSDQHAWFKESRSSRDNPRSDWYVWADPQPDGSPPNNWLSVFGGSAWQWDTRRRQYYLHSFLTSQPDLNFHCSAAQDALLEEVRFWCERGVDGFRFDACNHQVHDRLLRSNPPTDGGLVSTVRADNPYAMQKHLYDKSQPENLLFLERVRGVLDTYGAASIGEVGDENAPPIMAAYTAAGQRLHMAYSFSLLTPDGTAAHIRGQVESLDAELQKTGGWGCWALSNHDVPRIATRWQQLGADGLPDRRQPRTLLALLLSLRGSACLYQGEELGLGEANVPFERIQDPYGLAFWPEFKGRDGCRTPFPWDAQAPHAGFSRGEPWLPVEPAHQAVAADVQRGQPDSMQVFSKAFLHWRTGRAVLHEGTLRFLPTAEPVLGFVRQVDASATTAGDLLCLFNLGPTALTVTVDPSTGLAVGGPDNWTWLLPVGLPELGGHLELDAQGHLSATLPPFGGLIVEAVSVQSLEAGA